MSNAPVDEEEEWRMINLNVVVLTCEHLSFWLLKSFSSGWEIYADLRETAHELCCKVLKLAPSEDIELIPNDADFARLTLYAAAELVIHFTCLLDKTPLKKEDDFTCLLRLCRILLRYYSLRQNVKAQQDVKQLAVDLLAMNLRATPDNENFLSLLHDMWVRHSDSKFGDFSKIKAKRPSQEVVKKALLRIVEDTISNKLKTGHSSLLFDIVSTSHEQLLQREETAVVNVDRELPPAVSVATVTTTEPTRCSVDVSVPLPLTAVDIGALPTLSDQTISKIYDAFSRAGVPQQPVQLDSVRDYFTKNADQRLIIPVHPVESTVSTNADMEQRSKKVKESRREATKRSQRNGKKPGVEADVPLQIINEGSPKPKVARPAADEQDTSSMSSTFSEGKSPKKKLLVARATSSTPTTEVNPTLRALVRGVTSRKKAEMPKESNAPVATSAPSAPSVVKPSKPQIASQYVATQPTTLPSKSDKQPPIVERATVNTAVILTQQNTEDDGKSKSLHSLVTTPSVAAMPRLKDRVGAPEESSSSSSDDNDSFNISSSESAEEPGRPRKKRRPWTKDEYKAVMAGVKRFGEGKWREIQLHYPILNRRTNVAVKDAYRLILKNPSLVSSSKS